MVVDILAIRKNLAAAEKKVAIFVRSHQRPGKPAHAVVLRNMRAVYAATEVEIKATTHFMAVEGVAVESR